MRILFISYNSFWRSEFFKHYLYYNEKSALLVNFFSAS